MIQAIEFLAAPIVFSVLLVGIHAYLGLHILQREVIFVDISLSQVAALGAAVSLFFMPEFSDTYLTLFMSLLFCLTVSFMLAFLRHREKNISQEAIIGMTYALAGGAMILVVDKLPHGAEHLKETLVGNILFVTWKQVVETFIVYGLVGVLHYVFRRQFWIASLSKTKSFYWDLIFYFLFGVVITFSTRHAGVLVVFVILVAPAALASRIFPMHSQLVARLGTAWLMGVLGICVAFSISYIWDLPAGASIICVLTLMFFISLFVNKSKACK